MPLFCKNFPSEFNFTGAAVDYRRSVREEGSGGMNRDGGDVVAEIIVFIFHGCPEFVCE